MLLLWITLKTRYSVGICCLRHNHFAVFVNLVSISLCKGFHFTRMICHLQICKRFTTSLAECTKKQSNGIFPILKWYEYSLGKRNFAASMFSFHFVYPKTKKLKQSTPFLLLFHPFKEFSTQASNQICNMDF